MNPVLQYILDGLVQAIVADDTVAINDWLSAYYEEMGR